MHLLGSARTSSRLSLTSFLLSISLLAAMAPSPADAQAQGRSVQSKPTVGQQYWSAEGWLYAWTGNAWGRTQFSRTFPDANNTAVYDTFLNGQPQARVDLSQTGWIHEFNHQTKVQTRYPIGNPNARQAWIDHTRTGGPRGWVTLAHGGHDGGPNDPRNIPGTPEYMALKRQLDQQVGSQVMGLPQSVPSQPTPWMLR